MLPEKEEIPQRDPCVLKPDLRGMLTRGRSQDGQRARKDFNDFPLRTNSAAEGCSRETSAPVLLYFSIPNRHIEPEAILTGLPKPFEM